MTAFRIVDSTTDRVKDILKEMEEISPIGKAILNQSQVAHAATDYTALAVPNRDHCTSNALFQLILTEPALVYDSVYAFAHGLEKALLEGPELKMS
jgi:hypothetical protein